MDTIHLKFRVSARNTQMGMQDFEKQDKSSILYSLKVK